MARTDQTSGGHAADSSDKAIWQYCRAKEAEPDEAERFLDLAGFVDSCLDADEYERVGVLLASDLEAAGDVAAVQALAAEATVPEGLIARAVALAGPPGEQRGQAIPFTRFARPRHSAYQFVRWGSLAAAIAVASWLGFALGSDASLAYGQIAQPRDESSIADMLDPAGGVMRGIPDGLES